MKLYLLSQDDNCDYDTYDSCVVCAANEPDAINTMPNGDTPFKPSDQYGSWAHSIEAIKCEYIGEADPSLEKGVICASFNAG